MAEPAVSPDSAAAAGAGITLPESYATPVALTGPATRIGVMVRLRFRVLWNTLRRHPWQMVAAIIGVLYGLGVWGLAASGLVALSFGDAALVRTVLVLAGSVLVLGWMVGPIVSSGMDRTLDPSRLVMFPMTPGTQVAGIAAASLLGVPGLVTLLVAATTALAWLRFPLAAVSAVLLAPIAALTCVLACQLVMTGVSRLAASRRFRDIVGGVLVLLLMLAGPLLAGVGAGAASLWAQLPALADVLAWTPLGAAWAVPADLAAGAWLGAVVKLLIALVTVAALFLAWRALYLVSLGTFAGGSQQKGRAGTGWFGRFPATPRGAVAARAFTYWLHDPRYLQGLIIVLVMPVVFWFVSVNTEAPIMLPGSTVVIAALLALTTFTDVSYDGTAFSTHLLRGVRGVDDRAGRVWAIALVSVPLVLLAAVATTAIVGRYDQLPTLLGLSLAVLLCGFGVSSVSSALVVMPVPQSGENPFVSKPGAGMLSLVGMFACFLALGIVATPSIALAIAAGITQQPLYAWLTLLVGILTGVIVCWIGVRWGGRIFDRRAPELMERLSAQG